jgi:glucokinase
MDNVMSFTKAAPVLAVDIGGTKIMTALFSAADAMLFKAVRPTLPAEGVDSTIDRLVSAIEDTLDRHGLAAPQLGAIGIACAGGVDAERGVVVTPSPAMPGWTNIPLGDILRERFGERTFIVNDASAAAFGEHLFGAGRGAADMVLFTVGTGIGGGIVVDGRLYLGARGGAGELGHMTIAAGGPVCRCGNTGCLEMLASGRAVERDAIARLRRGEDSLLNDICHGNIEDITAEQVGGAARRGDPLALAVLARAAEYLGIGMVNAVNIFNPEIIVIGGGMAGLGNLLIEPARRLVAERAFSISSRAVRIVTAQLGNEAGVYGTAAYARQQARRRSS